MKLVRAISTAVLSLTLGIGISAYAQQEQHEQEESKDKPAQEKETKAQPEKTAKPEAKSAERENNNKPEEKNAQQHEQPGQRADGNHGRIPDDRFRANFGQQHTFRVSEGDYRNHRFHYGGYWFGFVDPWPSNWLYTQNVYVIDMNGAYYLCNSAYPGVNVAISVTL